MNSMRDFLVDPSPRVLVLGAGVVGLNTALRIQDQLPNATVTVRAERFSPDTTSNVAAGIFAFADNFRGPTDELGRFWADESWSYFNRLRQEEGAKETGIIEIPLYLLASSPDSARVDTFLVRNSHVHRPCTQRELDLFQPRGKWKAGNYAHTIVIDCGRYLPWATKKFTGNGGSIQKGKVESLQQLEGEDWDVVVNCLGFSAKKLCGDRFMWANRGQVMKVHAPWIKVCVYADSDTIIIPGVDLVTLGRTTELYNEKLSPSEHDSVGIWNRVVKVMPSVAKATLVKDVVGIRPTRMRTRTEKEVIKGKTKDIKVVHNYGHCGYGVMMSWGSAGTAARLVQEAIRGDMKNDHMDQNSKL